MSEWIVDVSEELTAKLKAAMLLADVAGSEKKCFSKRHTGQLEGRVVFQTSISSCLW
jgi:hypothetical protein